MTTDSDHYNSLHSVVLLFDKLTNAAQDAEVKSHKSYYKNLNGCARIIHYGDVMNENALCVIIEIASAAAFEQVICNDPALKSGFYRIKQVIPFTANTLMN